MRTVGIAFASLFLLAACAAAPPQETRYQSYCKTHARQVTTDETPVVDAAYRNCLQLEGTHEIEVRPVE